MSASEIIEEIKKLPREEQQQIAIFVGAMNKSEEGSSGIKYAFDVESDHAAEKVLRESAELFRKLAQ